MQLNELEDAKWAAQILRCKPHRVYELARRRLIPAVRVGRRVLFDPAQMREFIQSGGRPLPARDLKSQ